MAIVLASVFAISFVALGVGSGTGLNFGDVWRSLSGKNTNSQAASGTPAAQIKAFEAILAYDPSNVDAMLGIATQYQSLQQPATAAKYLEQAATIQPDNVLIYTRLGDIYLNAESRDYTAAVRVLTKATELDPADAKSFLQLGVAQRGVGNTTMAILAWNKYLELDPNGDMAATVKAQIESLKTTSTTTADASTTATSAGAATTTSAATTTTAQ